MKATAALLWLFAAAAQAAAPACVDTAEQLPAQAGPRAGSPRSLQREFDFAKLAGCVRSDAGTRRLLRVSLGEFTPPAALTIDVEARREGVLAPEVRIVDRDGRELARHGFEAFRQRGASFSHTLFLNDAAAQGGHVLIGNDPSHSGGSGKLVSGNGYVTPIVSPVVIAAFSNGYESQRELPFRDAGRVRVVMAPAQLRELP